MRSDRMGVCQGEMGLTAILGITSLTFRCRGPFDHFQGLITPANVTLVKASFYSCLRCYVNGTFAYNGHAMLVVLSCPVR